MIKKDQPTIFPDSVVAAVSSAEDGNIKKGMLPPEQMRQVDENREAFFKKVGLVPEQVVLVSLSYQKEDFCVYWEAADQHKGDGIVRPRVEVADALVTRAKGVALFLPIADCCPVILYDQRQEILMLSHLGRHNIEQSGGQRSVDYLVEKYTSDPKDILVWLGPAAGKETYPLFAFNNRSMHDVILEQLKIAGIEKQNVEVSPIDVAQTTEYFSHSEFLKGHRDSDGRFAALAMLK